MNSDEETDLDYEMEDVPFFDSIPFFSQFKSAVQVIGGDEGGARQTQINFSRTCPAVAQVRLLAETVKGDRRAAKKTNKQFVKTLKKNGSAFANGVPVVGHIKGGVHYALGDKERGNAAMKSASRTVGVVLGAIGGTIVGGPVGGVVAAVAAGVAVDGLTTGIESGVNDRYIPSGTIANVTNIVKSENDPGQICDNLFGLAATVALDGVGGSLAGKGVGPVGAARTVGALTKGQATGAVTNAVRRTKKHQNIYNAV